MKLKELQDAMIAAMKGNENDSRSIKKRHGSSHEGKG